MRGKLPQVVMPLMAIGLAWSDVPVRPGVAAESTVRSKLGDH